MDLDRRQRAMLQEMGVRVWWPEPPGEAVAEPAAVPVRASAVSHTADVAPAVAQPPAPRARPVAVPTAIAAAVHEPPAAARTVAAAGDGLASRPAGVQTMAWPQLQDAVGGCRACKLCNTRRNTVFGVGQAPAGPDLPPRADWLVLGEAPGENEDIQGEPFVGQAGKLLDNMLQAIGVARAGGAPGVFITNVLKCRPPGNRNPEPDEIAQCEPFLRRQIELLRPRIILAVGRFAVQTLLQGSVPGVQTEPLGRLRGKVYQYHGIPVVVSYHPAYLLRSLPEKARAWADLCLAQDVLRRAATPEAS